MVKGLGLRRSRRTVQARSKRSKADQREFVVKIGSLASRAEVSIDTLRFYEREGLISSPQRLFSGYRDYPEEVLGRLDFIKEAKRLGFSLREIKELLSEGVKSTRECGPVTHKAQQKLAEMEAEIERLQRL